MTDTKPNQIDVVKIFVTIVTFLTIYIIIGVIHDIILHLPKKTSVQICAPESQKVKQSKCEVIVVKSAIDKGSFIENVKYILIWPFFIPFYFGKK
ncbi:MAG: hypothetical protein ABIO02_04875 [Patescibacteria group bacterium]